MQFRYIYPRLVPFSGFISIASCILANFYYLFNFLLVKNYYQLSTLPNSPSFCITSESFFSISSRKVVLWIIYGLFLDLNLSLNSLYTLRASSREAGLASLKFLRKR